MLIALTPFRYGKGSQHWAFAKNDRIKDGLIDNKDIEKLINNKIIKVDTVNTESENIEDKAVTETQNNDDANIVDNRVNDTGYEDYLKYSPSESKELISEENSIPKLLNAKTVEERDSNPRRKKIICEAIRRRIYEITGKRIP